MAIWLIKQKSKIEKIEKKISKMVLYPNLWSAYVK